MYERQSNSGYTIQFKRVYKFHFKTAAKATKEDEINLPATASSNVLLSVGVYPAEQTIDYP